MITIHQTLIVSLMVTPIATLVIALPEALKGTLIQHNPILNPFLASCTLALRGVVVLAIHGQDTKPDYAFWKSLYRFLQGVPSFSFREKLMLGLSGLTTATGGENPEALARIRKGTSMGKVRRHDAAGASET